MAGVLSRLEILLHANTANFRRNMRRAADDARSSMGDIQKKAVVVAKGATAAFGVISLAAGGLVATLVPVQRQFDQMQGQLVTATGSYEDAAIAMEALNKFAAQTPYDLEQSVIGFTKLVNLGLTPSERALTSYGNTASAMGKSMEQMIEAVADAATSEFERLKEFGIKSSKEGDRVTFTFRGIKTEIGNNAAEIEKYLMDLGEVEFAGAMEAQMDTLNGRISQAEIALDGLKLAISQSGIGDIMKAAVERTTAALESMTAFIQGPEFNASIKLLSLGFQGFEKDATTAIDGTKRHLGTGLDEMGNANNRSLLSMANDWTEWSIIVQATVQSTVIKSIAWLDKLTINAQAAADVASNPLNIFSIGEALSKRQANLAANRANEERLINKVDTRFDSLMARRTKINQEATAAIAALGKNTKNTGDVLANYGIQAAAQQDAAKKAVTKQSAAEKKLANQREKDARAHLQRLKEQNAALRSQMDFLQKMGGEYDPLLGLKYEFQGRWDEIAKNLPSGTEQNDRLLDLYQQNEERLLTQAEGQLYVSQQRELERYSDYLLDKRTRTQNYYQQEATLAQTAFNLTAEQRKSALTALAYQQKREIMEFELDIESRIDSLRAPFVDDAIKKLNESNTNIWRLELETDLTRDDFDRIKSAIEERHEYEIAQILLTRRKELDAATDHQKTELKLIEQRYKHERQELELIRNIGDDIRQARLDVINAQEEQALFNLRNDANDAYQQQKAGLIGNSADFGIKQQFADRLKVIQAALDAEIIAEQEAAKAKEQARQQYNFASYQLALTNGHDIAGALTSSFRIMFGEQNAFYKISFAAQQSFAMASAGINMYKAWGDAMAEGATLTQKLVGAATIAAEFGAIISAASAMTLELPGYQVGGFTAAGHNSDPVGLVHANEFVANANTTRKYRPELEAMHNGTYDSKNKNSHNTHVNINVNVTMDGSSNVESNSVYGKQIGQGLAAVVLSEVNKMTRPNGTLDRLYAKR